MVYLNNRDRAASCQKEAEHESAQKGQCLTAGPSPVHLTISAGALHYSGAQAQDDTKHHCLNQEDQDVPQKIPRMPKCGMPQLFSLWGSPVPIRIAESDNPKSLSHVAERMDKQNEHVRDTPARPDSPNWMLCLVWIFTQTCSDHDGIHVGPCFLTAPHSRMYKGDATRA